MAADERIASSSTDVPLDFLRKCNSRAISPATSFSRTGEVLTASLVSEFILSGGGFDVGSGGVGNPAGESGEALPPCVEDGVEGEAAAIVLGVESITKSFTGPLFSRGGRPSADLGLWQLREIDVAEEEREIVVLTIQLDSRTSHDMDERVDGARAFPPEEICSIATLSFCCEGRKNVSVG